MKEFKKDIKKLFNENPYINSFGWVQYTSTDDFEFKIENIEINNKEADYNDGLLYLLSKYDSEFYFKSFGDYCDIKFNRDNSIIIKDYINN